MYLTNIAKPESISILVTVGTVCFGLAVGYITYRTLARTTDQAAVSDLATVLGAIGGATITTLFGPADGSMFAWYSIGLVAGMALYLILSLALRGRNVTGNIVLGADANRRG